MKEKITNILLVIVCILLVVCLVQISSLRTESRNKYNHLSNNVSNLNSEIRSITSNVSNVLEQEASILAHDDYTFGAPDMEALTIEFIASVTPKEYNEKETTAVLYIGDNEFPMTLENGTFTVSTPLPILEDSEVNKIVFKEGDIVRSEELSWHINPRYEAIMTTYADFAGSHTGSADSETKLYTWKPDGTIFIDTNKSNTYATKAEVAYLIAGETVEKFDMKIDEKGTDGGSSTISYELTEEIEIPYGNILEVCTIVTDNFGLRHVNIIERIAVSIDGKQVHDEEEWIWRNSESMLYDAEGNCIYNPYSYENAGIELEYVL